MFFRYFFWIILFLVFSATGNARDLSRTDLRMFWENDVFFPPSDHYYTNGIRFEVWNDAFPHPIDLFRLPSLGFCNGSNPKNYRSGLALGQNQYTPTEVERKYAKEGDRSYAAHLYLGFLRSVYCDNWTLTWDFNLGVVGKKALGEEIQTQVHGAIQSVIPAGWENQIPNANVIQNNFNVQYFFNKEFGFNSFLKLGNAHTSLGVGPVIRLGKIHSLSMAGTNIAESFNPAPSLNEDEFYFFIQPVIWTQVYDGTLQGANIRNNYDRIFRLEKSDLRYLFFQEDINTSRYLDLNWNEANTLAGRFWTYYANYEAYLPNNLPLNIILFNTIFNGNPRLDADGKKLVFQLLSERDLSQSSQEELTIIALALNNNGKSYRSEALYLFSLNYFSENIASVKPFSWEELYFLTRFQNMNRFAPRTPRTYQGKLNLGFVVNMSNFLYLQLSASLATPEFYPSSYLPQTHQWGSIQLIYRFE